MTTLQTPRGIHSISDRAMLVGLHMGKYSGKKTDKKISREVAEQHGAHGESEKSR